MRHSPTLLSCLIAVLLPSISTAQRHIHFTPTVYYRTYSTKPAPVLQVLPGDTVTTESVDAVGFDKHGVKVTERGNPLTGPFFVDGAMPGDVLAVKLIDVRLNRNYATTLNALIPKIFPGRATMKRWKNMKMVRWDLDTTTHLARPADRSNALANLTVPLAPFLGCVGVAPSDDKSIDSGGSGDFGGNMDFLFNTTGATVYLPVEHPGALLSMGDGHAVQGDGELNGDALETSMRFSFSVQVLKKETFPLTQPVIENDQYWMFFGIKKTLDRSLQSATEEMVLWLEYKYGLSRKEVSQVVGPAIQYKILKTAGGITEVVAIIPKAVVSQLKAVR